MLGQLDASNLLVAFLGAGGLAAIAATITKYLLERRKMQGDYDTGLLGRMQERIDELEAKERDCMNRNAEMAKRIGYLEARVESLDYMLKNSDAKAQQSPSGPNNHNSTSN